eukprot:352223-Chlamydomonas_euryale.AAC.17
MGWGVMCEGRSVDGMGCDVCGQKRGRTARTAGVTLWTDSGRDGGWNEVGHTVSRSELLLPPQTHISFCDRRPESSVLRTY